MNFEQTIENWLKQGWITEEQAAVLTPDDWKQVRAYFDGGLESLAIFTVKQMAGQKTNGPAATESQVPSASNGPADNVQVDPQTGFQWIRSHGKLFYRVPTGTVSSKGEVDYGDWKIVDEKSIPFKATQFVQSDGSISPKRTADTIGYVDQAGVPQAFDKALLPSSAPWKVGSKDWITDAQGNTVGYYDEHGVPTPLAKEFLPSSGGQEPSSNPVDNHGNKLWVNINGRWQENPSYIDPVAEAQATSTRTRQIQNDLDAQNQARFNRQTQDQTNAINQWIASQKQADIPQSQYQRDFEMWQNRTQGLQGPGDWINYWNAQQMPPPARPIGAGQSGVRGQFGLAENAADAAAKGYTSWVPTRRAQTMAGVDMNRQQVWDPVQHAYRPETDTEYQYRTVTQPAQFAQAGGPPAQGQSGAGAAIGGSGDREQQIATDIQAYMEATRNKAVSSIPGWANLSPNAQNNILLQFASKNMTGEVSADAQNNVNRLRELSASQYAPQFWNVGPKVPDYLKNMTTGAQWTPQWNPSMVDAYNRNPTGQYGYNPNQPGQYQVNLNTLGGKNNQVRAASAQQWQNWLPSQREGYMGLLRAQNQGRVDMNDILNQQQQMWQSSRPGQLATKVTRGY